MDDFAGAASGGFQGFVQGWRDSADRAERRRERELDREMKEREWEANRAALEEGKKRQKFMDAADVRKSGFRMPKLAEGQSLYDVSPDQLQYDPQYLAMKLRLARAAGGQNIPTTPAEKEVDKAFAKDYADYYATGGKSTVDKQLGQLDEAVAELSGDGSITGGWTTKVPLLSSDTAQDIINPKMAKVRDQIRGAIQGTLRQVMGPQFTEKEGTAIFNRAFNPRLSDAENVRRAQAEIDALKAMAGSKESAARYYEEHGTLKGFKPASSGLLSAGLVNDPAGLMKTTGSSSLKVGHIEDGMEFTGGDPSDEKNWKKIKTQDARRK